MSDNGPFAGVPAAITSRFRTSKVNEAIVLYAGLAVINETDGPTERNVVIVHEWTPRPAIICRYSTTGSQPFHGDARLLSEPISIEIPSLEANIRAYHYDGYSCGDEHKHGFAIDGQVEIGVSEKMSRAVFHVINCRDFSEGPVRLGSGGYLGAGRIELVTPDWQVTIDRTDDSQELVATLQQTGGRALTHRVEIRRGDASRFDAEQLGEVVALIEHFIAFVTGAWACLALPIGYDGDDEVWQVWRARQGRSWTNPHTWSSHLPAKCVRAVFRGFANRFMDEDWNEPLRQTVDWYVQCRNGTAETSIILCQAALELLAWVVYIENGQVMLGTSGFENLWASDRIRLLLAQMQVTYEFPPGVKELGEFEFDGKKTYADGPHAITEIRNGITHPKTAKRERFGSMGPLLRYQASELGLFYLECCLLGLCGYFGPFRADPVCRALCTRMPTTEPLYPTADFNQLFSEMGSNLDPKVPPESANEEGTDSE